MQVHSAQVSVAWRQDIRGTRPLATMPTTSFAALGCRVVGRGARLLRWLSLELRLIVGAGLSMLCGRSLREDGQLRESRWHSLLAKHVLREHARHHPRHHVLLRQDLLILRWNHATCPRHASTSEHLANRALALEAYWKTSPLVASSWPDHP